MNYDAYKAYGLSRNSGERNAYDTKHERSAIKWLWLQGDGLVSMRVVQDVKCITDGSDMRSTQVLDLAAVGDGGRSSTEHVLSCQRLRF